MNEICWECEMDGNDASDGGEMDGDHASGGGWKESMTIDCGEMTWADDEN